MSTLRPGAFRLLRLLSAMGILSAALAGCSPPSGEAVKDINATDAGALHETLLVIDAHADVVIGSTTPSFLTADGESRISPEKLKAGGVGAVVVSVAAGPGERTPEGDAQGRAEADERLNAIFALARDNPDSLTIARTSKEVVDAHERGLTALILGFQNARSLEGDVDNLDRFYDAGVRVFALNHLGHNDFSDSSRPAHNPAKGGYEPPAHNGLSALGRQAIERINTLGGVVDVSQMSKEATLQAIALSKTPVIASHSNVRAISDATRNLSDEEIDRIGQTGGVIHISPFAAYLINFSTPEKLQAIKAARETAGLPAYYSYPYELYWELPDPAARATFTSSIRTALGPASVDLMADHIDYIVKRIGVDHVGIGTDFNHGGGIEGYEDASQSQAVTEALLKRGYSPEDIAKIWGGNFMRVFSAAETAGG